MATVNHGSLTPVGPIPYTAWVAQWTPLTPSDAVGDALEMPAWADRSVQITGTFDSATVVLQGSNDGTNWATLSDPQGNPISATSAKLEQIEEITRYIRPSTSGGSSSQSITVTVLITGARRF